MIEQVPNKQQNSDESELKQHLDRIENENSDQTDSKDVPNAEIRKPYEPNSGLLDFLQDKPITVQRLLITRGLSPDQKKKIESVFQANANELSVNRAAIREILIDLCEKYPEVAPYFSNKTIFIATFGFGYYERSSMAESILATEVKA
jgi:hypothetical protein